ncbi:MAG: non-canonical purine NTP pyrophosphatase [Kiritimatiellaeota bacterium]|nr:non-canonical purine NTP pyrophosphatase [Kiritimatiellota bacterium]
MKLCLASGNAHKAREFQALVDAGALRGLVTTGSAYFSVTAVGCVGNAARRVWAILQVMRDGSYVLRWREEI